MSRDLLSVRHHRHPLRAGEVACTAFAEIDLAGLARYFPTADLAVGEVEATERFLARRWSWSRGRVRRFLEVLEEEGKLSRPRRGVLRLLEYPSDFMLPEDAKRAAQDLAQGTVPRKTAPNKDEPENPAQDLAQEKAHKEETEGRDGPDETASGSLHEPYVSVTLDSETGIGGKRKKKRQSGEAIVRQTELAGALFDGPTALLKAITLPGLDRPAAVWICERVRYGYDWNLGWTAECTPYELAAACLDDMERKGGTFTRSGLAAFMVSTVKARTTVGDQYNTDAVDEVRRVWEPDQLPPPPIDMAEVDRLLEERPWDR
ncbi:MAG: hypothetical protein WD960_14905 [Gemmatimonadota bacterium]